MALSLGGCAWIQTQERLLIYRPTPAQSPTQLQLQPGERHYAIPLSGEASGQQLTFWWLPQGQLSAPTLLYFHGTFRNLEGNRHKLDALYRAGFSVLALDYRGWGQSSPLVPSESSIMQDAEVAWHQLQTLQPEAGRRVIFGHSMGSAVAVDLASRLQANDYGALVLESAFTSFSGVAREAGLLAQFLNLFSSERFDSLSKIDRVQAPLLMLHGDQDRTIPMVLGARLYDAAKAPKQWITLAGGHSDLDLINPALYQNSLQTFVCKHLKTAALPSRGHAN